MPHTLCQRYEMPFCRRVSNGSRFKMAGICPVSALPGTVRRVLFSLYSPQNEALPTTPYVDSLYFCFLKLLNRFQMVYGQNCSLKQHFLLHDLSFFDIPQSFVQANGASKILREAHPLTLRAEPRAALTPKCDSSRSIRLRWPESLYRQEPHKQQATQYESPPASAGAEPA